LQAETESSPGTKHTKALPVCSDLLNTSASQCDIATAACTAHQGRSNPKGTALGIAVQQLATVLSKAHESGHYN